MASGSEQQMADCLGSQRAHLKVIHWEILKVKNLVLRLEAPMVPKMA